MRKDVRVGAVIGGILIAVMVVYAIVASKGHGEKKKDPVVFDSGKTSAAGDSTGSADAAGPSRDDRSDAPAAMTGGAGPTPPAAPSHAEECPPAVPASSDGKPAVNWGALLSADRVEDVMPVRTHTPEPPHGAVDSSTVPGGDAIPSGHSTPGDVPTRVPQSDSPARTTGGAADSHVRATTPATGGTTHRVASGETFSSIARTVYGNAKYYKEIIKANPKVDPTHLKPGMVITLPDKSQFKQDAAPAASGGHAAASGTTEAKHRPATAVAAFNPTTEYRVQPNDNLYKISTKLYHSANKIDAIYQLNKTTIGPDPARLKLNMVLKLPEPPTQTASR